MKMFNNALSPADYLGERYKENQNGAISFTVSVIRNFCDTYTYIDYDLLNNVQKQLLKGYMIKVATSPRFPGDKKIWDGKKVDIQIL